MERKTELVNINGLMGLDMKESGLITLYRVMVYTILQITEYT